MVSNDATQYMSIARHVQHVLRISVGHKLMLLSLIFFSSHFPAFSNDKGRDDRAANSDSASKLKLVFVLEQGFGNGPVVSQDIEGIRRTCQEVKKLKDNYDVYLLFGPHIRDKQSLIKVLDMCREQDQPFMFDVASSDGMTLAALPQTNPSDETHGLEISLEKLSEFKHKYGDFLAGMRFMEIFGQDYMVRRMANEHPEWKHEGYSKMPDPEIPFFDPNVIRPYFEFAKKNNMFVQWSDHTWSKFSSPSFSWQIENERQLCNLINEFPDTVYVTYANNEGNKVSRGRYTYWHEALKLFMDCSIRGFGLSNQPWLYFIPDKYTEMECPIEEINIWSNNALDRGAKIIQFEPYWYFFYYPRGTFSVHNYTESIEWRKSGTARKEFESLRKLMNVRAEIKQLEANYYSGN